ncbi:hypothetical protein CFE70_003795 [Pyrenophora teres f. teres 0-1]
MKSLLLPLILTLATTALTAAIASPSTPPPPSQSVTQPATSVLHSTTSAPGTDIHKVKKAASRPAPSTSAM